MSKVEELFRRKKRELIHVKCYLDEEKHAAFSKLCKSQGISMSEALNACVDDLLAKWKVVPISHTPKLLNATEDEE